MRKSSKLLCLVQSGCIQFRWINYSEDTKKELDSKSQGRFHEGRALIFVRQNGEATINHFIFKAKDIVFYGLIDLLANAFEHALCIG